MAEQYLVHLGDQAQEVEIEAGEGDTLNIRVGDQQHSASLRRAGSTALYILQLGQRIYQVVAQRDQGQIRLTIDHRIYTADVTFKGGARVGPRPAPVAQPRGRRSSAPAQSGGLITAPIAGLIVAVSVAPGDQVESGTVLLVLEAMKMQNEIRAPRAATVKEVYVEGGQRVEHGARLVLLE